MPKRRDPLTKDLFAWEPPQIAIGYGDEVSGRGRLDSRIARTISHALRDVREEQDIDRAEVANRMSDYLGRKISVATLNQWTAEASEGHRIPLDAFIGLIHATGAKELLGFVAGLFGLTVIDSEYAGLIEEQLLKEHKEEVDARLQVLATKRKARR